MFQLLLRELLWQRQSLECSSHQSTRLIGVSVGVGVEVPDDERELLCDLALTKTVLGCWTWEESNDGAELGQFWTDLVEEQVFVCFLNVLAQ